VSEIVRSPYSTPITRFSPSARSVLISNAPARHTGRAGPGRPRARGSAALADQRARPPLRSSSAARRGQCVGPETRSTAALSVSPRVGRQASRRFSRGQAGQDAEPLRHVADAEAVRLCAFIRVVVECVDEIRRRPARADQPPSERSLAEAVVADDADGLAGTAA